MTVKFEQTTEQIFDIPLTVTITYASGRTQEEVVSLTERTLEWTSPTSGLVRQVQVNRDYAAIARFDSE